MSHIQNSNDAIKREYHISRLLQHSLRIPDATEVMQLLRLLREMNAISEAEANHILERYIEGQ